MALLLLTITSPARAQPTAQTEPWWGEDKAAHFASGFFISAVGYAVGAAMIVDERWPAAGFGAATGIGLGAAKEGLDAAGLGTPSWKDFTWTTVGAVLGVGVSLAFDAALRGPLAP